MDVLTRLKENLQALDTVEAPAEAGEEVTVPSALREEG
jgi:hypothetical protein